ncbi:MAG: ATP synthase F1 subunit delta [Alphaproteobacteria bacterium]|nr:ATP synthase F1 subunit delta [Alphaproteobacteria bacterium]MDA7983721.1 ATP synthase F1 subunit delta [Alphaproteobacteria bacterium]MDA7989318.1 ATP synthase F1 subunit delta [Alphaproteobacteria bacterium]MDA8009768.1 ATP synthase F1 subunit delta [Alphaproteobacteria bacterium]
MTTHEISGGGGGHGVAGRYALALLGYVEEAASGEMAATEEALKSLKSVLAAEPRLVGVLVSPQATDAERGAVVEEVVALLNEPVEKLLRLLVRNGRAEILPQVAEAALAEIARRRGEVVVRVSVANPLGDADRERLMDILTRVVGSKPVLHVEHDPALLGGLVVRLGSRMFDGSLKGKLDRLSVSLSSG